MNTKACSRPDCVCGIRCINCETQFVESPNDVCSNCLLLGVSCNFCKIPHSKLYKKFTSAGLAFKIVHETDQCDSCGNIESTDAHHLCETCHKEDDFRTYLLCADCYETSPNVCVECRKRVDILIGNEKCPSCYYGQGWEERRDLRTSTCYSCKRTTYVDDSGICRSCYVDKNISMGGARIKKCPTCSAYMPLNAKNCGRCTSNMRKCVACKEKFVPVTASMWQCHDCSPSCRGCGQKFVALNYREKFCVTCALDIKNSRCVSCRKQAFLNSRGHCQDCGKPETIESTQIHYKCMRCDTFSLTTPFGVCEDCASTPYACPECNVNLINGYEFLCQTCENKLKLKHIPP